MTRGDCVLGAGAIEGARYGFRVELVAMGWDGRAVWRPASPGGAKADTPERYCRLRQH